MPTALEFIEAAPSAHTEDILHAVRAGLQDTPKQLSARHFYDAAGSRLFERICELPEYYVTRTERRILSEFASEMVETAGGALSMIEFGSGSACKTRLLIEAALDRQTSLHYVPIDISTEFLRESAMRLRSDYGGLRVTAIAAEYHDAIGMLPQESLPRLFLFLGSNIGNFAPDTAVGFLEAVAERMAPDDSMLIGIDLRKDPAIIEAAYNDSAGVTAAFNLNLLARLNRELGADFNLSSFRHHAPYLVEAGRVEMRLVSTENQVVRLAESGDSFEFASGEYIHTENSHKYSREEFEAMCAAAGLQTCGVWTDEKAWFACVMVRRS